MNTLNKHQIEDAVDMLRTAQEHLRNAVSELDAYYALTNDTSTKRYIRDHLRTMIDDEHGFISRDRNLNDALLQIEEAYLEAE